MSINHKTSALLLSLILSACGGGGGGGGGGSTYTPMQPAEPALFQAVALPELKSIYDSMCGYNTNLQNIFVADLNKDGKKDLILTFWCNQPSGSIYDGPSTNGIIALTQQKDGSFIDDTKKIFGVDYINLNGVAINAVVNDFNNDGYDDIVFAVSREDGRLPSPYPALNHNEYNAYITSNGTGGYNIIRQGQFAWNYGVSLIENDNGTKDVISIPIGYNGIVERWSYNSSWNLNTDYQWIRGMSPLFSKDKALTENQRGYLGLNLYSKINGVWSQVDTYSFGNYTDVPWLSWQKSLGVTTLMSINGKDYVSVNTERKCNLKINPNDNDYTSIIAFNGQEIIGGYKGGTIDESSTTLKVNTTLLAFETKSNKITKLSNFKINNFIENTDTYHLVCKDLNNDGYDDIMIQDWRPNTVPMIYLNDKQGQFNMVSMTNIPGAYQYKRGQSYIYEDIDGDGIRDLLYFPIVGLDNNSYSNVRMLLYKGTRNLASKDLLQ